MNYHQGRNSGPNLDGGEEIRTPVNFVHPWSRLKNHSLMRFDTNLIWRFLWFLFHAQAQEKLA